VAAARSPAEAIRRALKREHAIQQAQRRGNNGGCVDLCVTGKAAPCALAPSAVVAGSGGASAQLNLQGPRPPGRPTSAPTHRRVSFKCPEEQPKFSARLVAPGSERADEMQARRSSEWARILEAQDAETERLRKADVLRRRKMMEDQKNALDIQLAEHSDANLRAMRAQQRERKAVQQAVQDFEQIEQQEAAQVRESHLKDKTMREAQMAEHRQARAQEMRHRKEEEELEMQLRARLLEEEKARLAAAKEARRQEAMDNYMQLQVQVKQKKLAVRAEKEEDIRLTSEYVQLAQRQEAARAAELQERLERQTKLMERGEEVQDRQRAIEADLMARVEQHQRDKNAADDAKAAAAEEQRLRKRQEQDIMLKQQLARRELAREEKRKEERRTAQQLHSEWEVAKKQQEEQEAATRARAKAHQCEVLAQVAEVTARRWDDLRLTTAERSLNATYLSKEGGP